MSLHLFSLTVPYAYESSAVGVYADRTAGGDRDHCRVDRSLAPRRPEGEGGGGPDVLLEQPEADEFGAAQLSRHQRPDAPHVGDVRRGLLRPDPVPPPAVHRAE